LKRSSFIKNTTLAATGLLLHPFAKRAPFDVPASSMLPLESTGRRIGVVGLDSSHGMAFSKLINQAESNAYHGYKVIAAYPYGSTAILGNSEKIKTFTREASAFGLRICTSLEELLSQVDCVLLETTDGRMHYQQAEAVFKAGKPVFIDKPLGANFEQVKSLYKLADHYGIRFFSASALRYIAAIEQLNRDAKGAATRIIGAETFSPCTTQPAHDDLYWYGIHGVEMLYAVMGTGCKAVRAVHTGGTDLATGLWEGGRIGTFRGTRTGVNAFGGIVFTEKANVILGDFDGYEKLVSHIIRFFETGVLPVAEKETKEIYAFMSAFQLSKTTADWVPLEKV